MKPQRNAMLSFESQRQIANDREPDMRHRVLIMEDDQWYRTLLETLLRGVGYRVLCAEDGVVGMRAMRQHGADVVITDLFMPEQDGLQTIRQLKREFPGVRVVAITAGAAFLSLENARATAALIGADAFIEKPLDRRNLLDVVRHLLPA